MAHSLTAFTYLHSTPGRMRIRIPSYRGDELACRWMEEALAARPGITRVTANALTGSVLILFDAPGVDDRHVLRELRGLGLAGDLIAPVPTTPGTTASLAEISSRVGTAIGKELVKAALTRAVGGSPAGLILLFL